MSSIGRVASEAARGAIRASRATPVPEHVLALLPLAGSFPARALVEARRVLDSGPADLVASYAHQAAGIVLRDSGEMAVALTELRAAIRSARRAGNVEREADVRATLGAALVMAGRTSAGLAELGLAEQRTRGELRARVRLRRAHVLGLVGRYEEALHDLGRALEVTRRSGDLLWQARIRQNRCAVNLSLGALNRAQADAMAAEAIFDQLGQALESAHARHGRGIIAARRGDLPGGLRLFDEADRRYRELAVAEPDLVADRGQALLAAGLATEAVENAASALEEGTWQPVERAELLLFAAKAALAAEQPKRAQAWANSAARLFAAQQRPGWQARARLLAGQARYLSGERTARLLDLLDELAPRLVRLHAEEAPLAFLLAGRLALDRGQRDVAMANLTAAAGYRRRGSPLARATGWLAVAMQASAADRAAEVRRACGHDLDALDEHRLAFGAAELRAVATSHGRDLAMLALSSISAAGSPRLMLEWAERWRATALAEPSVRSPDDAELEQELAALRDAVRRVEEIGSGAGRSAAAVAERDHWEAAVHRRRLHLSGSAGGSPRFDTAELIAALGDTRMIVLVDLGGVLHALTVGAGRVRRQVVGSVDVAVREIEFARFALRRAAHSRRGAAMSAARLEQALLGPAVGLIADGPVVVVPPARLHAAPWSQLPTLSGLPVSVSPSASMWLRARSVGSAALNHRRVVLVVGPDLGTAGAEVGELASLYPAATVLGAESAARRPTSTDEVLAAMEGSWIAHIAAHGTFRADSPLFSSLNLDDGPLFVHDLDRLRRPPQRVVLSACDTGVSAPVGADELLGMVSGLLRIGTAGVLASTVPVNDEAAVGFMTAVHRALGAGAGLPAAAQAGRSNAAGDLMATATAASFTVWGT